MYANTKDALQTPSPYKGSIQSATHTAVPPMRQPDREWAHRQGADGSSGVCWWQERWNRGAKTVARSRCDRPSARCGLSTLCLAGQKCFPTLHSHWAKATGPAPYSVRMRRHSAKAIAMFSSNQERSFVRANCLVHKDQAGGEYPAGCALARPKRNRNGQNWGSRCGLCSGTRELNSLKPPLQRQGFRSLPKGSTFCRSQTRTRKLHLRMQ